MIQDTTDVQALNRQIALDSVKDLMTKAGFTGPYECNGFDGYTNNDRRDPNDAPPGPHIRLNYTVIFVQVMHDASVLFHGYHDVPWGTDIYESDDETCGGVQPTFGEGLEILNKVANKIASAASAPTA